MPDANEWRLWALDEIAESVPESPNEFGVAFADYMLYTSFFLLRPAPHGEMEVLHEQHDVEATEIIAPSLSAFFDTYLIKPLSLIDPDAATSRHP